MTDTLTKAADSLHALRVACRCGHTFGVITPTNGQNVVRCAACNRHQYNAPKTETGEKPRTVAAIHDGIKASQRTRILTRDLGRCTLCGSRENLHAGHIFSVAEGLKAGLTEYEINHDENLVTLCESCNLGQGGESFTGRLMAVLIRRRAKSE